MSSRRKRIVRPSRAHGSSPRRASSYTVERGSASIAATSEAVITSSRVILRGRRGEPSPAANGDIALIPLPHEIARIVRAARRMSKRARLSPRSDVHCPLAVPRRRPLLLLPATHRLTGSACARAASPPPRCLSTNRFSALRFPDPATRPTCHQPAVSLAPRQPAHQCLGPTHVWVGRGRGSPVRSSGDPLPRPRHHGRFGGERGAQPPTLGSDLPDKSEAMSEQSVGGRRRKDDPVGGGKASTDACGCPRRLRHRRS